MHALVVVSHCDSRAGEDFMPLGNQTPGLFGFVLSPRCIWLPRMKAHGMHVEDVTDEDHAIRLPLLSQVLAERQIPRMRCRFVNVADDKHPSHTLVMFFHVTDGAVYWRVA